MIKTKVRIFTREEDANDFMRDKDVLDVRIAYSTSSRSNYKMLVWYKE